jgi:hypothetical protein
MTVPWLGARRKRRGRRETFAASGGCNDLFGSVTPDVPFPGDGKR